MIYDKLQDALDQLIQGDQRRIRREHWKNNKRTWTTELSTLPSLWDQLCDATAYQGQGGGAQGKPRLPITAGIVDIINEITVWTREAVTELPDAGRRKRDDIPGNLRGIAAHIISTRNEGLCADWTKQLRTWTAKAQEQLNLNPPHPQWARGSRCPECGARNATTHTPDGPTRTPALAINWSPPADVIVYPPDPWIVRAVTCMACNQAWFRGESLNFLVDAIIEANATLETLTDAFDKSQAGN